MEGGSAAAIIADRAIQSPHAPALTFVAAGSQVSFSFTTLQAEVEERAAFLTARCPPGSRIVLEAESSIDFVAQLLAAQAVGCIPVPVPAGRESLERIVGDCAPTLCIGSLEAGGAVGGVPTVGYAAAYAPVEPGGLTAPPVSGTEVAFLQYTSGSTGRPKGVVVTHANLRANVAAIAQEFGHDATTTHVSWLPLYHDMGLVGMLLQPLMLGAHSVHVPHTEFLKDPFTWLGALSDFRGVTSASPDFGYRYTVRRLKGDSRLTDLDLSSWENAINGAELPRATTMRDFVDLLGPVGFETSSFRPSYGLAESTLLVSAGHHGDVALGSPADSRYSGMRRVACGEPVGSTAVEIVDEDGNAVPEGTVGRIMISGPSVSGRYWPSIPEPDDGYFDTRDLGWLKDGQIHVVGRADDTIIVRGANVAPDDIEAAVVNVLGRSARVVAAVQVESDGTGGLGVIVETTVDEPAARSRIERDVVTACVECVGVAPEAVVLVAPGAVPRTTSGKLRRSEARSLARDTHESA